MRSGPPVVAAALLLALAGCAPTTAAHTRSPHPSSSPVFASDADALKAAEAAYAAYLKVSDQIAHDGGKDPDRIKPYVTSDQLLVEAKGAAVFSGQGLRTTGETEFGPSTLQQVSAEGHEVEVSFYTCWIASSVRLLNQSGKDVTPPNRVDRQTLEIVMTTTGGRLPLVLSSDEPWSASSSC